MGIFNEILSGRYNRALQKIFAIKGSPPVRQLGGEILPIVEIFYGVEQRFMEQWNRFGMGSVAAGFAGLATQWRWNNPVTSGVVAVLERLTFSEAAADEIFLSMDSAPTALGNAAAIGQRCLDNRATRGGPSTLGAATQWNTGTSPVTGGIIARVRIQAGIEFTWIQTTNQEIPLLPGDSLEITTASVANSVDLSAIWRERALEESEKT